MQPLTRIGRIDRIGRLCRSLCIAEEIALTGDTLPRLEITEEGEPCKLFLDHDKDSLLCLLVNLPTGNALRVKSTHPRQKLPLFTPEDGCLLPAYDDASSEGGSVWGRDGSGTISIIR